MYGLINETMRRLVTEDSGADTWKRIAARADTTETFAAMHYYDDDMTFRLVSAAEVELGRPADDLLRDFGRFWSLRMGPESYGDILGATGTDVVSVLTHLDEMHSRLQTLYPELRPPSFAVRTCADGGLEVEYRSERRGLAPMVVGLLEGLGDLYGTPATVAHVGARGDDRDHDLFLVRLAR